MNKRAGLSRRAFLRGAGSVAIALPMLELTHARVWAQAASGRARRFVCMFGEGGIISGRENGRDGAYQPETAFFGHDMWRPPTESETLVALGQEMAPLEPYKADLLLLRGINNRTAILTPYSYGGGHGISNATALTAADLDIKYTDPPPAPITIESVTALGPSIDQAIARKLAASDPTAFESVMLGVDHTNYGHPWYHGPRQLMYPENNPQAAFDKLFAGVNPSGEPSPELIALKQRKQSVLDGAMEGIELFKRDLGAADLALVDQHFEHLRSLETRLEALGAACTVPPVTPGASQEIVGPLMVDIGLHALRCRLTNVVSFEIGDFNTPWLDSPLTDRGLVKYSSDHSLHHQLRFVLPGQAHADLQMEWVREMVASRNWRMSLFGQFIQGLKDFPEDSGTMLDQSLLYYTSEFSRGELHSAWEPPTLLAGRAGGHVRTGRYINYDRNAGTLQGVDSDVSLHNLYVSFLQAFGGDETHFGSNHNLIEGPLDLT